MARVKVKKVKGGVAVDILCEDCNKPLTYTDEFGMFCADKCGREEAIKAKAFFDSAIAPMLRVLAKSMERGDGKE